MPTRLLVLGARAAQVAMAATIGWIVGTGVSTLTEPYIQRLKARDLAPEDAVRYVPAREATVEEFQEHLDRVEAELEADA
ncbi:MAG TPA: hypothetical protein VM782_01220 [Stellaceae bacterium]|nr:hypothetical protein [Stellaceae bacterium]